MVLLLCFRLIDVWIWKTEWPRESTQCTHCSTPPRPRTVQSARAEPRSHTLRLVSPLSAGSWAQEPGSAGLHCELLMSWKESFGIAGLRAIAPTAARNTAYGGQVTMQVRRLPRPLTSIFQGVWSDKGTSSQHIRHIGKLICKVNCNFNSDV